MRVSPCAPSAVGPATHRGPRVPARCRGLQRAHSASLLPRLSGLRLRLLRPRFAQLPSAVDRFRSWEGRGSPCAVPRTLDQRPGTTTSKTAVHATAERLRLGLPGMPLMPATFPPALGASRTLAASCALGADLPLCRLILCGRILRVRNLLMILNFAPNQCRIGVSRRNVCETICSGLFIALKPPAASAWVQRH